VPPTLLVMTPVTVEMGIAEHRAQRAARDVDTATRSDAHTENDESGCTVTRAITRSWRRRRTEMTLAKKRALTNVLIRRTI
jgi:hypothetical protein